jgi:4-diphosphocytidyl-2-C-methyl-D-erythritol kinase
VMRGVRVHAPAKINLYLGVGARRSDGYHDVETILQSLELHDEMDLSIAGGLSFVCEPAVGVPDAENLALRAATALAREAGRDPAVNIVLRKRIPAGAGLGGGSSDAAAALAGLAVLWDLTESLPLLERVASSLGSDVGFFLGNGGGTALLSGRGDMLVRSLPTPQMNVVIIKPSGSIATAAAYRAFDLSPVPAADPVGLLRELELGNVAGIAGCLANNMEEAARTLEPEVSDALAWLRSRDGVLGASVAGSGSAVFAICAGSHDARSVAASAAEKGWWSTATVSRDRGVAVERMEES